MVPRVPAWRYQVMPYVERTMKIPSEKATKPKAVRKVPYKGHAYGVVRVPQISYYGAADNLTWKATRAEADAEAVRRSKSSGTGYGGGAAYIVVRGLAETKAMTTTTTKVLTTEVE